VVIGNLVPPVCDSLCEGASLFAGVGQVEAWILSGQAGESGQRDIAGRRRRAQGRARVKIFKRIRLDCPRKSVEPEYR
jgi:hypothetical protein